MIQMLKEMIMKKWVYMAGFGVLVIFFSFAIYNMVHLAFTSIGLEQRLAETIGRLLASIFIVAVYKKIFVMDSFGLRRTNILHGLAAGWFWFCIVIFNCAISIMEVQESALVMPSVYLILLVIIEQLFVGIFEEFLFRGFILNMFLSKRENGKSMGKIAAVLFASVLFGLVHFLNLFDNPQLVNYTISQVFYALFTGIYLGALYLKTKSIWVAVICHTVINLYGELLAIFYESSESVPVDISVDGAVWNILFNSVFAVAGLLMLRKQKDDNCNSEMDLQ